MREEEEVELMVEALCNRKEGVLGILLLSLRGNGDFDLNASLDIYDDLLDDFSAGL